MVRFCISGQPIRRKKGPRDEHNEQGNEEGEEGSSKRVTTQAGEKWVPSQHRRKEPAATQATLRDAARLCIVLCALFTVGI